MIKKKFVLLSFLIVGLSGCLKQFRKSDKKTKSKSEFVKAGGTHVFSDDAEEFRLDGDGNDVFADGQDENLDDFKWDEVVFDDESGEVVQFDFDSSDIKKSEKNKIAHNAELAKQEIAKNKKAKVACKGHSCKIAKSELYNRAISQKRAHNVKEEYKKRGVPADKVSAVGFGASEPLTDADGREAQSVNRRVETDFVS